jgi:alpha-beta hydrolase superfamily lysophospholipase
MLEGIIFVNDRKNIDKIPKNLPVLLISGDKDPVGKNGKSVKTVYNDFQKSGLKNVEMKLYEDARHEILNELNNDEVFSDIIEWLEEMV